LKRSQVALALVALSLQLGCGGDSPAGPEAQTASPAPVATTAPTNTPAPTPTASSNICPNGQTKVVLFETKVFSVVDKNGDQRHYEQGGVLYVGETFRLDSQGKDQNRRPTNGCEPEGPRWDWDDDRLANLSATKGWNPRGKVLAAGTFTINANLDHIDALPLILKFEDPPLQ
jgi:hypothetical protein